MKRRKRNKRSIDYTTWSSQKLEDKFISIKKRIGECKQAMKQYELDEEYLSAAKEKQKIQKINSILLDIHAAQLHAKQKSDNVLLKEMSAEEQQKFNHTWDDRTSIYIEKMKASYQKLKKRQDKELHDLRTELSKRENNTRTSSLLLNLRLKQHKLAKSKRYIEAENIRRNADIIEQEEKLQHCQRMKKANQKQLDSLYKKHQIELEALRQRFSTEKHKLTEARNQDYNKLKNRLRKFTLDIEKRRNQEIIEAKRNSKNISNLKLSNLSSTSIPLSARNVMGIKKKNVQRSIQSARRHKLK